MRFIMMVKYPEASGSAPQALRDAIAALATEAARIGVFIEMGKLLPTSAGARVRLARRKITVADGPFTDRSDVIHGYAVYEVVTQAEAIAWTRRFMELHLKHWPGWEGEVEVRQLLD